MRSFKGKTLGMFWCKIGLVFFIMVIVAILLNQITDPNYRWRHYGAYRDKLDILEQKESPKTIFVGGSSVLFGVNAQYYEELSGEAAVNMGLHAFKSPDIYLACIEPYVNAGDTVVIALEHYAYASEEVWQEYDDVGLDVAHLSKEYYRVVPLKNRGTYCWQQILRSFEKASMRLYATLIKKRIETLYLRENINAYGDLDDHLALVSQEPDARNEKFIFCEEAAEHVKNYIKKYQAKGASVYIVFAPIYCQEVTMQVMKDYYNDFRYYFGKTVLGNPKDWTWDDPSAFYDTGYHLIREEALKHTKYYYELIKNAQK